MKQALKECPGCHCETCGVCGYVQKPETLLWRPGSVAILGGPSMERIVWVRGIRFLKTMAAHANRLKTCLN